MIEPRNDGSWIVELIGIFLILWLWVATGCATLPVEVPTPKVKHETSVFTPPDIFMNGPVVFTSAMVCPLQRAVVQVGRSDALTIAYAYLREGDGMVYFMITQLSPHDPDLIKEAWVDTTGDGAYDLYFAGEYALRKVYPSPCDAIGIPM